MPRPWERLPEEPPKAWAAFVIYRNFDAARRSLTAAWRQSTGRASGIANRRWQQWSSDWRWAERTLAYDAYRDERERAELERERMRFVRKQARFQFEAWDIQRDQLARTNAVLRKLEAAPVASADKIETREESIPGRPGKVAKIVTRMKVKGISPSGYARVVDVHTKLTHDLSGFLVPGYKAPQAAPAAEAVAPSAQYSYDLDRLGDQELTEFRALTEKVTVVKETPPEEDADPVFE